MKITPVSRDEAREAHKLAFPADHWCAEASHYWLAYNGAGQVIGFLALGFEDCEYASSVPGGVYLSRFAAAKGTKGVGKRLLRFAARWAKSQGAAYMHTYCLLKNYASLCAMLAVGWKLVDPPKSKQHAGSNVHYFVKALP